MPGTAPSETATSTTAARTRSGTASPGRGSRSTTVTCSTGAIRAASARLVRTAASDRHAHHVERGEVDRGSHQGGRDERVRAGLHPDDGADRDAGEVRPAFGRAEGLHTLPGAHLRVRAEQPQAQQPVAYSPARDDADLPGSGHAHPHAGGGVGGQPYGGDRVT